MRVASGETRFKMYNYNEPGGKPKKELWGTVSGGKLHFHGERDKRVLQQREKGDIRRNNNKREHLDPAG